MSLSFDQKQTVVSEVYGLAVNAHSVLAAEYVGITVQEMTNLRVKAREGNVVLRVVKNTLAKRALENTDFACMSEELAGQLVLAFSQEDPGGAARVMSDFARENDKLVIKLVVVDGQLYDASEVKRLASLPTKDQAVSMLMSVVKAPVGKLARTMNEVPGKLVRTVAAIRSQKETV